MRLMLVLSMCFGVAASAFGQEYDFLLKNGHVIDARSGISAVRDVAIKDGRIAEVAQNIDASRAVKAVDASGLYVTTVADAGGPGWRNFEDFKTRIVDQSRTRVTTFLNIVGSGMAGAAEQNLADMEVKPTADMASKHKGVIVGIKSALFSGPQWAPYETSAARACARSRNCSQSTCARATSIRTPTEAPEGSRDPERLSSMDISNLTRRGSWEPKSPGRDSWIPATNATTRPQ